METALILLPFLFIFFVKSVFGFGGLSLSFIALGFFIDTKEIILAGLVFSLIVNALIFMTDPASFMYQRFIKIIGYMFPSMLIGTYCIEYFSSEILLKIFATFILLIAVHSFFDPPLTEFTRKFLLFFGGLSAGMFSIGEITAAAMKNDFSHKSQFRTTFSALYFSISAIRFVQLFMVQNTFHYEQVIPYWWTPLPIFLVVWLGHKVHLRTSEKGFKLGLSVVLVVSAIAFLFR